MTDASAQQPPVSWDLEALYAPPVVHPAPGLEAPGVRGMFMEGLPYQGKPTRVFAWFGLPDVQPGQKVPAMVLVHGGGGTAFDDWVRLWTSRGYAAIAIDWNGQVPQPASDDDKAAAKKAGWGAHWHRHDHAGPIIETAMVLDIPLADQWQYHAIAAIIMANSFIANQPEVDPSRIGLTGISWGGYLSCIASGVDQRFKLVMPVYGCGFLDDGSAWEPQFAGMGPEKTRQWMDTWDPSRYVCSATMPMLFTSGTNDFAYGFGPLLKTVALAQGPTALCLTVRMTHDHPHGQTRGELLAFADSILKGQPGLVKVTKVSRKENRVFVSYALPSDDVKVVWAELNYTTDSCRWVDRRWQIEPVYLASEKHQAKVTLPEGTVAWYVNLIDSRGLVVSSDPQGAFAPVPSSQPQTASASQPQTASASQPQTAPATQPAAQ